jgi:hypothetical protein
VDLANLDRRIIYVVLCVVLMVSLAVKIELPVPVGPETRKVYESIDSLSEGSIVMMSFDFEASSQPEIQPVAEALFKHVFKRNLRVVGLALFAEGTGLGYNILSTAAREADKTYGSDYIYLGFRPQYISAILGMGENIKDVFPLDYFNRDWQTEAGFAGLNNYDSISLIVSIADGSLPTYWVEYAGSRYAQKIAAGITAVMATSYYPYTASGQLVGLVSGLRGAAEYENLLGYVGGGQRGMVAQSAGHLAIIALVALANLAAFRRRG